jgi:hypothetical protein
MRFGLAATLAIVLSLLGAAHGDAEAVSTASGLAKSKLAFLEDILTLRKGFAIKLLKSISTVAVCLNHSRFADELAVNRPSIVNWIVKSEGQRDFLPGL